MIFGLPAKFITHPPKAVNGTKDPASHVHQVVDPLASQRASQKSREFNVRYGAAIHKMREEEGLAITAIPGLSPKQLRRIERGECRLTSNTAKKLALAHGMTPNEYLQAVATALQ